MTTATAPKPAATSNGTAPTEKPRNLWQRIADVQGEVENIAKAGKAPEAMGAFAFVRDVDVYAKARELFSKHGIAYTVAMTSAETEEAGTTSTGKPIYRSTVSLLIRLRNVDEPSEVEEITWTGCGDDTADKGLQKAATSAAKYALLKALLIGGDDPDAADATGGEGRGNRGATANPEDDYGPCDQPGCPGRLVAKVGGKNKTRMVECSEHGYVGKDGKRRGGNCTRETDWHPDWPWYEAHRNRAAEAVPIEGGLSDAQLADTALRRFIDLARFNQPTARSVLTKRGWDGEQRSAEWMASLKHGELLVLVSDLNAAIAASPAEIPFGGPS